jgi:hypothetical protein
VENFLLPEQSEQDIETARTELKPAAFLQTVVRRVQGELALLRPDLRTSARSRLAKLWFGTDGSIHYEVWVHDRTAKLELGFHCESTPEYNRLLYKEFDLCLIEIQARLGPAFWLEEWDRGWIRLYETHPLWPLYEARVEEIAFRLMEVIDTIQPIFEEAASRLPPAPPPPPEFRSTWRGTKR